MQHVLAGLIIAGYVSIPLLAISGWMRWRNARNERKRVWHPSFIGFVLGCASLVWAVGSIVFVRAIGGFPYYDPHLRLIYRTGLLISLFALLVSLGGLISKTALRWHAPALSLLMLLLWIFWAAGE